MTAEDNLEWLEKKLRDEIERLNNELEKCNFGKSFPIGIKRGYCDVLRWIMEEKQEK
jgi:hypothetical protein